MNRLFRRATTLAALGAAVLAASAASATSFVFTTTSSSNSTTGSSIFTANNGASSLSVLASAWNVGSTGAIAAAQLGLYTPGLGVLSAGESYKGNEHQISNEHGVDFIMLQFSQAVSLTSIGRAVFTLDGKTVNSDAAYKAASAGVLASEQGWNQLVDLSKYKTDGTGWTTVAGGSSANTALLGTSDLSKIWYIGAAFAGCDYDAFKLSSITVGTPNNSTPPGAVPEPASWGLMLMGFGAVGAALRRRRSTTVAFG